MQLYSHTTSTVLHPEEDRPLTVSLRPASCGMSGVEPSWHSQAGLLRAAAAAAEQAGLVLRPSLLGLQVREAARVQGFPDWVEFAGSVGDCYKQVGFACFFVFGLSGQAVRRACVHVPGLLVCVHAVSLLAIERGCSPWRDRLATRCRRRWLLLWGGSWRVPWRRQSSSCDDGSSCGDRGQAPGPCLLELHVQHCCTDKSV